MFDNQHHHHQQQHHQGQLSSSSNIEDLLNDGSQAYFIHSIKSLATRKIYTFVIKKYMQHYNLQTIDELLAVTKDPAIIEDKIIKWLVSLRPTGVTFRTRHTYMCALIMFYEINDVILRKNKDRAYTIEEIRKLLDHAQLPLLLLPFLFIK